MDQGSLVHLFTIVCTCVGATYVIAGRMGKIEAALKVFGAEFASIKSRVARLEKKQRTSKKAAP